MEKETSKHYIFTFSKKKKYTKVVMRSKGKECTGITMNGNKLMSNKKWIETS